MRRAWLSMKAERVPNSFCFASFVNEMPMKVGGQEHRQTMLHTFLESEDTISLFALRPFVGRLVLLALGCVSLFFRSRTES